MWYQTREGLKNDVLIHGTTLLWTVNLSGWQKQNKSRLRIIYNCYAGFSFFTIQASLFYYNGKSLQLVAVKKILGLFDNNNFKII